LDVPRRRAAQIIVHHGDLLPPQLPYTRLHAVLQFLALDVVLYLIRRRLTDIENGFTRQMVRLNLITHRPPPCRRRRRGDTSVACPAADVPTAAWLSDAPPQADSTRQ